MASIETEYDNIMKEIEDMYAQLHNFSFERKQLLKKYNELLDNHDKKVFDHYDKIHKKEQISWELRAKLKK